MRPTNVLFINADQHNPRVLGCAGNQVVRTPSLDALAARGTRFERAFCPFPICVPSRASLATGRYAHTIDSWDNQTPYLGTEAASWGHRLTEHGHRVTTIGKLHYRRPEDPTGFPDQRIPMHVVTDPRNAYGILRGRMLPLNQRQWVLDAGPGETEYTRYDLAIAAEAERFLREETAGHEQPWALFVSFLHPHIPLVVPEQYFALYPPESVPLPTTWHQDDWSTHPAARLKREQGMMAEPFTEATVRRAIAAYYGMVTFLDDLVGRVLHALDAVGLRDSTRVIYTADHGEMLGAHGLWWKECLYDESVGVPLIVAGPDVPAGRVSRTPVSLVDCFPAIVEAVGAQLTPDDADLPGESLLALAQAPDRDRTIFAEYHAAMSSTGAFMLRQGRYKLIYHVGLPAQFFDSEADPDEAHDLADDPAYADVIAEYERVLRSICDPEAVDRRARADQQARIDAAGGAEAVLARGLLIRYTPAPEQFGTSAYDVSSEPRYDSTADSR
jgi:choline-sulfatase